MFSPRVARRSLKRYRAKGLGRLERMILASAGAHGFEDARVLEIGGGIGALHSELLSAGAASGEVVELASAYEPYARELARERGLESRTTFRVADVLERPEDVQPAAIVLLNRVVCCSPEGVRLAGAAARLAQRTFVFSFPRDRMLVRAGIRLANAWLWLLGRSFRVFLHPPPALVGAVEAEGLRVVDRGRVALWEFAALERP
jgi:magnesium-protoporphyrin O-methyltransferase